MRVRLYFWQTNEFTIKIKTWKKKRIVLLFSTKVVIIVVVVLRSNIVVIYSAKPNLYFDRLP